MFIVFQLQSVVKFLIYDTNIFLHLQIYHDKGLYNKGNMIEHGIPETIIRRMKLDKWILLIC